MSDIDYEKWLAQGYIITEDNGRFTITKTPEKEAEGIAKRKAMEADFDRRMNLQDPYVPYVPSPYLPLVISIVGLIAIVLLA